MLNRATRITTSSSDHQLPVDLLQPDVHDPEEAIFASEGTDPQSGYKTIQTIVHRGLQPISWTVQAELD